MMRPIEPEPMDFVFWEDGGFYEPKQGGWTKEQRWLAEEGRKRCSTCRVVKDLEDFWPNRYRTTGFMSRCKICHSRWKKEWAQSSAGRESQRRSIKRYIEKNGGSHGYRRHFREVFERDNGVCQLCNTPVSTEVNWPHPAAPTLDHIVCQSWTEEPDHSPENLRLACWKCNRDRKDDPEGYARWLAEP